MLAKEMAVKIDAPDSEFHGEAGFVKHNPKSGPIEPCDEHNSLRECEAQDCEDAVVLPDGWYVIVFDPMDAGGFAHCTEWFAEEDLVVNGC